MAVLMRPNTSQPLMRDVLLSKISFELCLVQFFVLTYKITSCVLHYARGTIALTITGVSHVTLLQCKRANESGNLKHQQKIIYKVKYFIAQPASAILFCCLFTRLGDYIT